VGETGAIATTTGVPYELSLNDHRAGVEGQVRTSADYLIEHRAELGKNCGQRRNRGCAGDDGATTAHEQPEISADIGEKCRGDVVPAARGLNQDRQR
jgi:hypothetical protein